MLYICCACRIPQMGHPRLYSTWRDEGFNSTIAQAAAAVHPSQFETRLLERIDLQTYTSVGFGAWCSCTWFFCSVGHMVFSCHPYHQMPCLDKLGSQIGWIHMQLISAHRLFSFIILTVLFDLFLIVFFKKCLAASFVLFDCSLIKNALIFWLFSFKKLSLHAGWDIKDSIPSTNTRARVGNSRHYGTYITYRSI